MDQDNASAVSANITPLGGKSWTAYVGICLIAFVLLLVVTPVAWRASWVAGLVVLLASTLFVAYRVLLLRSYSLYHDDDGVWIYSGILPWNKGVRGVKWRDIDEAVFFQTMWSWLFKSYSLRIGHRFTKSSEILLSHMARGHESVSAINAQHQQLIRNSAIK